MCWEQCGFPFFFVKRQDPKSLMNFELSPDIPACSGKVTAAGRINFLPLYTCPPTHMGWVGLGGGGPSGSGGGGGAAASGGGEAQGGGWSDASTSREAVTVRAPGERQR